MGQGQEKLERERERERERGGGGRQRQSLVCRVTPILNFLCVRHVLVDVCVCRREGGGGG